MNVKYLYEFSYTEQHASIMTLKVPKLAIKVFSFLSYDADNTIFYIKCSSFVLCSTRAKQPPFMGVSLPRVLASGNRQSLLSTKMYMSVEWDILTSYLERISRLQSKDYGQWFNRNFQMSNSRTCGKFIVDKLTVPRLVKNFEVPWRNTTANQLSLSWGRLTL